MRIEGKYLEEIEASMPMSNSRQVGESGFEAHG
jgi:hypothetical protein